MLLKVKDAQDDLPDELQTPIIFGQQNGNGSVVAYQGVDWAADKFSENKACDYLGCSYIWVDDATNTVSNITSDAAVAHYDRMYKWWHEGLISKDASTTSEYSDTCLANGQYFCCFSNAEYGAGFAKSNNTGRDLCALPVLNIGLTTSYVNSYGFGLPMTCENPEAATAFMDLLFGDKDIANLLVWGIEGRDYEVDENGCAYRLEGHTYEALEYFQGNQFHAYPPQQPEGSAYRQNQWNDNVNGYISPFFGLVIDNTEIANELTAVQNVVDKYYPVIACGQVKADDAYIAQFDKEMNEAGMDKILAFYQNAVDEWLASK
jgi:putative aldouronate transport system substrate-binding protein